MHALNGNTTSPTRSIKLMIDDLATRSAERQQILRGEKIEILKKRIRSLENALTYAKTKGKMGKKEEEKKAKRDARVRLLELQLSREKQHTNTLKELLEKKHEEKKNLRQERRGKKKERHSKLGYIKQEKEKGNKGRVA